MQPGADLTISAERRSATEDLQTTGGTIKQPQRSANGDGPVT